jgi:lanosterol synthase
VNGLLAAGAGFRDPAVMRACEFLRSVQREDGGWGEGVKNCEVLQYDRSVPSQAVMTSWALLTLIAAGHADDDAVRRGIDFLLARQCSDGTFPDENLAGVFNRTCAIHYDTYLKIFPMWALGTYRAALVAAQDLPRRSS